MKVAIKNSYLGLDYELVFSAPQVRGPLPTVRVEHGEPDREGVVLPVRVTRDDAAARAEAVLVRAAQRAIEILAVAQQDVLRERITAALQAQRIDVVRVEVHAVGAKVEPVITLSADASDNQRAAADAVVAEQLAQLAAARAQE